MTSDLLTHPSEWSQSLSHGFLQSSSWRNNAHLLSLLSLSLSLSNPFYCSNSGTALFVMYKSPFGRRADIRIGSQGHHEHQHSSQIPVRHTVNRTFTGAAQQQTASSAGDVRVSCCRYYWTLPCPVCTITQQSWCPSMSCPAPLSDYSRWSKQL